ncbi:MAG TPA: AGE family epimerase/isomerase [Prolixibacteraceae bacterium]|nr:AGE family epimerase/isomerase [Prolixibacteraceae bacterium]
MKIIAWVVIIFVFVCCKHEHNTYLGLSTSAIETAANNHLNIWYPNLIDSINGGYFTNFEYNWQTSDNQDKMLVTQARGLWTAAKAANTFTNNQHYLNAAQHGFHFLTTTLWNNHFGGFKLNYKIDHPNENEDYNLIYANAFALFALAEYAKTNLQPDALQWAIKTFNWIDSIAYDTENKGYFNLVYYNKDTINNNNVFGWNNPNWKDQNTSIHILEAYTTFYQIYPNDKVRKRLEEMLLLIRDTMVQADGSLKLFFTSNWQAINHSDSSRNFIIENQEYDHISFGHNIETAYLLIDASKTLYQHVDSTTLKVAKQLCDHTLKHGFDQNFYGLFNRAYDFDQNGNIEIIDNKKDWWAQYEAWHTLALMLQYFPENEQYNEAFISMWNYINNKVLDPEYGGCFNCGIDTAPDNTKRRKAHAWKGPYHDGRALMLTWQYANN